VAQRNQEKAKEEAQRNQEAAARRASPTYQAELLAAYQAKLQTKIKDAWNIPSRSKGLKATFFLSLNRAGQVEQARLVQGSGNTLFDDSIQRAIKQSQPLPALPEDFPDRTLELTLPFRDTRQ
jgi:TonB family protein